MGNTMKFNPAVGSSKRKNRKDHFQASSSKRWKMMSVQLGPHLRKKYCGNATPVRKDDEVQISRGTFKGRVGKVTMVYRKKMGHIYRRYYERKSQRPDGQHWYSSI